MTVIEVASMYRGILPKVVLDTCCRIIHMCLSVSYVPLDYNCAMLPILVTT